MFIKHVFVFVMLLIFMFQVYKCAVKYLEYKVVYDNAKEEKFQNKLPSITFCPSPGIMFPKDRYFIVSIEEVCPSTDEKRKMMQYKDCFNNMTLPLDTFLYHISDVANHNLTKKELLQKWRTYPMNMFDGTCFTFDDDQLRFASYTDGLLLDFSTRALEGRNLNVILHNSGKFVHNILGLDVPQQMIIHKPEISHYTSINLEIVHHEDINTDNRPCVEEEDYNMANCIEEFVTEEIKCSSPWQTNNYGFETCSSLDQMNSLFMMHKKVFNMGAALLKNFTGCQPPCKYNDFKFDIIEWSFTSTKVEENDETGVFISFKTTSETIVKQTFFYDINNLVGEIGGSLGLFLGASCLTLFDSIASGFSQIFMRWGHKNKRKQPKM